MKLKKELNVLYDKLIKEERQLRKKIKKALLLSIDDLRQLVEDGDVAGIVNKLAKTADSSLVELSHYVAEFDKKVGEKSREIHSRLVSKNAESEKKMSKKPKKSKGKTVTPRARNVAKSKAKKPAKKRKAQLKAK